ncbi:MAG: hypothetical protein ACOCX0_02275 [Bacteroidota bacterium]
MSRHITYSIEDTLVVWIEKSNQWLLLREPEQKIYQSYLEGKTQEETAGMLCREMLFTPESAATTVKNLFASLEILDNEGFPLPDFSINANEACQYTLTHGSTHHYHSNGKSFTIRYGSPFLEYYIHLPFSHLAGNKNLKKTLLLEVFPFQNRYALRINGNHCKTTDESPQIKRLLYVALANYLYDIPEEGWMTRLHASAVYKGDHLLLLNSPSGYGKSTMAALLMKEGFGLFADDYIPVCLEKKKLYPFPAALSIKKGSMPVLEKEGIYPHLLSKQIGYIQPKQDFIPPLKANQMVFINYVPESDTIVKKVSAVKALQLFLQEAWVSDHAAGAWQFIKWFNSLRFWQLQYSDNHEGVAALKKVWKEAMD